MAVPNDASRPLMDNFRGTIVLVECGKVSIATKAHHAQEAGAEALVVIDSGGSCSDDFECDAVLGSKVLDAYFTVNDSSDDWLSIFIPVVVISKSDGERLKRAMPLVAVEVQGLGLQYYSPSLPSASS